MIFGIKEKSIILTHAMAIATNIPEHLRLVLCSCGIFSLVHFYQGLGRLLKGFSLMSCDDSMRKL